MANRHGLIAGATGTGKTVTLQTLAEGFSKLGVPVFMADVKGDLAGMSQAGGGNAKIDARVKKDAERAATIKNSVIYGHYENVVDRESAYEKLKGRAADSVTSVEEGGGFSWGGMLGDILGGSNKNSGRGDSIFKATAKSAARAVGSQLGRSVVRGVLGSLFGGKK